MREQRHTVIYDPPSEEGAVALPRVEASAAPSADLRQRLEGMSREALIDALVKADIQHRRQEAKFSHMLDIGSALGSALHVDQLLETIVEKTTELMDAERSTLFLVDDQTRELWSKVVQGGINIEIRLQQGQGIAGWVALTGKSLNIRDAYQDPRFNPKVDEDTGYITRNILCQPIRNLRGDITGVLQVLNRREDNFTDEDEYLLSAIASQAAIAIENSKLYLSAVTRNMELIHIKDKLEQKVGELDLLFELERLLGRAQSLEALLRGVGERLLELVHVSAMVVTLPGDAASEIHLVIDRGEWKPALEFERRPMATPTLLAQEAQRTQQMILLQGSSALADPRLRDAGERFKIDLMENALALPLRAEDELIGTLEVYNAIEPGDDAGGEVGFSPDHLKIIGLVASQLAGAIQARRRRVEQERNDRLATIGQMLSGVLHDFKNPMAVISGYVQLLAKVDDPEQRRAYAASVLKQFEQLNQMTRELLSFARGDQTLLLRKTYMHKLMEELRELLEPELARRDVTLRIEMVYRNDARIDQVKLKRALLNLARNAADAMAPKGGEFVIHVSRDEAAQELVLACSDTGAGIPLEIQDRLFESFVTQGKKDGTGLGLAIVKKIVEEHHGSITFTTAPGQGTTFTMRLPLAGPAMMTKSTTE